ncbi:MAG: pantetheine-phosphate adenylyltransferase [Proteobacteria bacterium]|nr:pantetheine-phosphate adenylyltransferase [Pseudomonadota bacterium]
MNFKAIYPGTFDPITNGHIDLIKRASKLFPSLIVAVAENRAKKPFLTLASRLEIIKEVLVPIPNVSVLSYSSLLVDLARKEKANVILRGLRSTKDFEFEFELAGMNRNLAKDVETLFITPSEEFMFVSSSFVRELASFDGDISPFVPPAVLKVMQSKKG